jgi:hypothetical protein
MINNSLLGTVDKVDNCKNLEKLVGIGKPASGPNFLNSGFHISSIPSLHGSSTRQSQIPDFITALLKLQAVLAGMVPIVSLSIRFDAGRLNET